MAISDELNRIILAKADIKSALEEKGLTIGDSSTLDEYPALILEMETGGGGGSSADTSTLIDMIESDITSIVIPSGVKKIGHSAFMNRKYLTSVQIPSDVSNIEMQAFSGCTALRSIDLPSACTKISVSLLSGCLNLESFVVKDTVTEIDTTAFNNIGNNVSFAMLPTIPPTLLGSGSYTFGGNNATWPIYVKNAVVDTYKNAGGYWNDVSKRILALAEISYSNTTKTVLALGRNVELYIDSTLLNSDTYTFDINTETGSHTVMVKSIDASLGVLDTVTETITVDNVVYPDLLISVPYGFNANNKNEYVSFTGSENKVQQNNLTITNNTTISDPAYVTVIPLNNTLTFNTSVGTISKIELRTKGNTDTYTTATMDSSITNSIYTHTWTGNSLNVVLTNTTALNSSISTISVNIDGLDSVFVQPNVWPIFNRALYENVVQVTGADLNNYIYQVEDDGQGGKTYTQINNPLFIPNFDIADSALGYTYTLMGCSQEYGTGYSKDISTFTFPYSQKAAGSYSFEITGEDASINDENLYVLDYSDKTNYYECNHLVIITDGFVLFYVDNSLTNSNANVLNKYPAEFRMVKSQTWYLNPCGATITSVVFTTTGNASYDGDTNTVSEGSLTKDGSIITWSGFTTNDTKTISTDKEQMRVSKITINYEID